MRKGDYHYTYKKHGRWYNLVLGPALMGVILFPHLEYPLPHYLSAGIFFGGSALVIAIFCNPEHRAISMAIAVASAGGIGGTFCVPGHNQPVLGGMDFARRDCRALFPGIDPGAFGITGCA